MDMDDGVARTTLIGSKMYDIGEGRGAFGEFGMVDKEAQDVLGWELTIERFLLLEGIYISLLKLLL